MSNDTIANPAGKKRQDDRDGAAYFHSQDLRERQRRQRMATPLWQVSSLAIHAVVILVAILCTPVRQLIVPDESSPNPRAESKMSERRIKELSAKMDDMFEGDMLEHVANMKDMLDSLESMRHDMLQNYDDFARDEASKAGMTLKELSEKLTAEIRDTVERQEKVLEAAKQELQPLVESKPELSDESKKRFEKASGELRDEQRGIVEKQAVAQSLLDVIADKAKLFDAAEMAKLAEEARARQLEAADAQNKAKEAMDKQRELQGSINYHAEKLAEAKQAIEQLKKEVADRKAEQEQVQGKDDRAKRTAADKLRRAENSLKDKEGYEKWATSHIESLCKERAEVERKVIPAQQLATAKQKEMLDQAVKLAQKIPETKFEPRPELASFEKPEAPGYAEMRQMDVVDSFNAAKKLEQDVAESYRKLKAAELSVRQRISIGTAMDLVDVVKPVRSDADVDRLRSSPRTESAFKERKEAIKATVREVISMEANAAEVLQSAYELVEPYFASGGMDKGEPSNARLARMYELSEMNEAIAEAAAENSSERSKDLSELMKLAEQSSGESPQYDKASDGDSPGGKPAKDNVADSGEPAKKSIKNMLREIRDAGSADPGIIPQSLAPYSDGQVPGNVIGKDGLPCEWMYVNSWYVIGPFPNPNRVNLRRKFPPESVIDLDATYIGKDGRTVRWEYEQASRGTFDPKKGVTLEPYSKVLPSNWEEYGIWYAYTEVFLDEPRDLWVALGSDDRSDIWVNDINVWGSSNELKDWNITEGFRKIHFRKGRNKVLMRVENGHWTTKWSMCIKID